MTGKRPTYHDKRQPRQWRNVKDWPAKPLIFLLLFVAGFAGDMVHVPRAALVAGVAMIFPILGFHDFWCEWKFWITIGLLAGLQVPVVILVEPYMKKLKVPFMIEFGIVDFVFAMLVISWTCSEMNGSE